MLTVIEPGWATRIVDAGRPGSRSLGVPVGGAADRASWLLGNALVGNSPDVPALEIAVKGPTLRTDVEMGAVVMGASFPMSGGRQALRVGRTFTLEPGDEIHIGGAESGMRGYLCVSGGFDAPRILGSRSALDPVRRGQVLPVRASRLPARFLSPDCTLLTWSTPWTLRVLPGGQTDEFAGSDFLRQSFTVSPVSNRMGLRLLGHALPAPTREMLSEPVCPGTVQVTKDGQCIILGVDGQTIGGYPKIAHVIHADLDALGQMRPGDLVRFQSVGMAEAQRLNHQRGELLDAWIMRCRVSLGR